MAKNENQAATEVKMTYTKEQLAASKRFANRRDVISALLESGRTYTLDEAEALIDKFMKGKVI